jgi:hypothetical protein
VTTGITVYTIVFTSYGNSTATRSGSFVVSVSGRGSGTFECKTSSAGVSLSGCSLTFTGVTIAPGATFSFQLTMEYNNFASGALIDANLNASYTTSGSPTVYVPSRVPAEIIFTVQGS